MKRLQYSSGATGLPVTPGTLSPKEGLPNSSSMPNGVCADSYFPPVEEYWSSKNFSLAPPTALAPLLPTPESPALPLPEIYVPDLIPDEPKHSIPTCSCPATDTCVIEALALLFGSAQLLTATVKYHKGNLDRLSLTSKLETAARNGEVPKEIVKLEPSLRKLIAPFISGDDFDLAEILWKHWRCQQVGTGGGRFADNTDLCGQLRESLEMMCLDIVDTFAPIQHDVDTLLAHYNYTDEMLQSQFEALEKTESDPTARTKLLLEANAQLSAFSMTASTSQVFEVRRSLFRKVEDLAGRIDLFGL